MTHPIHQGNYFILLVFVVFIQHFNLIASRCGDNEEVIRLLLSYGADVNAQDSNEQNALFNAIFARSLVNVRVLVENGIEINTFSYNYVTPLQTGKICLKKLIKRHFYNFIFYFLQRYKQATKRLSTI